MNRYRVFQAKDLEKLTVLADDFAIEADALIFYERRFGPEVSIMVPLKAFARGKWESVELIDENV